MGSPGSTGRTRGELLARWSPVVAWMALISFLSTSSFTGERTGAFLLPLLSWLFPGASSGALHALHHAIRKLGHVIEYFVLSLLLYRALSEARGRRVVLAVLAVSAFYALADEMHQALVPGRTAAAADWLLDVAGAATAQAWLAARRADTGATRRAGSSTA